MVIKAMKAGVPSEKLRFVTNATFSQVDPMPNYAKQSDNRLQYIQYYSKELKNLEGDVAACGVNRRAGASKFVNKSLCYFNI
jgi:hypothetical protein